MPQPTPSIAALRDALADSKTDKSQAFWIAKGIAAIVNGDDSAEGRNLVIRALDRKELFDGLPGVLDSLVRSVGLFPYAIPDNLGQSDRLAYEYHRADNLDVVFHREQAEIYRDLSSGQSLVLSAPTSFGKSLVIDSLIATGNYKTIIIIVPTIALIDETRRRLSRFASEYKIVTHGSQSRSERTIFVVTQERAIDRDDIGNIDLLVIDEFYKLDPGEDDGDQRSLTLNHAFYKLSRQAKQIYLLGPNINQIPDGFGARFKCTFKRTDFNTVVSELRRVAWRPNREDALIRLCGQLSDPTLIYCKSKKQVHDVAKALTAANLVEKQEILSAAADWAAKEYHSKWSFVEALRSGIGVHHSGVPRALAQQNVAFFNDAHLRFLVCTSSLIEGVNTSAKNVIIYEGKIATKKLDYFTFNNIRGRSGRMRRHFIGNVYIFDDAPEAELDFVDIPAFTQGEDAPLALLAQIQDEDLSARSRIRLRDINDQRDLSMDTIRKNSGLDPDAQISLAKEIQRDARRLHALLSWTGYPNPEQLKQTCQLIYNHFVGARRDGVSSGAQLSYKTSRLWNFRGNIKAFVADILATDTAVDHDPDAAVLSALEFQRSWAMFRFPRLLMGLDRIQNEIFQRQGLRPGHYGKFASDLESGFMPPELVGLDEYGLPIQLGQKLAKHLNIGAGLDAVIQSLKNLDVSRAGLTTFEQTVVQRVRSGL